MRLIDADALEEYLNNKIFGAAGKIKAWIDAQPTVDAVSVVRCKDCKHLDRASRFCFKCMDWVKDTWYCANGERRENDG